MNKIYEILKYVREKHNYTQNYVADYLSVSQNTYSHMERGQTRITIERLLAIAMLYKMDITELIKINPNSILPNEVTPVSEIHSGQVIENIVMGEERQSFIEALERLEKENSRLLGIIENLSKVISKKAASDLACRS